MTFILNVDLPGMVQVNPRRLQLVTSSTLAQVTTAAFLNSQNLEGRAIYPTDIFDVIYSYNSTTNTGTYGEFLPTIVANVITLALNVNAGNVLLPVVSGDVAIFNGTSGQIKDSGAALSNASDPYFVMSPGSVTSGNFPEFSDTKGTLGAGLPPSAASQAYVVVSPGSLTSGHVAKFSDANGTVADSGIVATSVAQSTITNPDAQSDLIWYDITASAAALASTGKVNVQISSGSKQYVVRDIRMNYSSAGLSGGSGNRLLALTDGTNAFNNAGITAALLGTPINTVWGGTGNPLPGSLAMDTLSVAGANIYLQYAGGTTDYTTGSVVVSVLVQRVA